ncbi:MAG: hypothetical protein ACO1OB_22000 [Archangium sp.]
MSVVISITQGDVREVAVDVLAVKYAQAFHSSDGYVADALREVGVNKRTLEANEGEVKRVASHGAVKASEVLFVGTVSLRKFGYHDVRTFASRAVEALGEPTKSLAVTLHGANCGLDEEEAVLALVGGLTDAIQRGLAPATLSNITIVELREARAQRMQAVLEKRLSHLARNGVFEVKRAVQQQQLVTHGTVAVSQKPHAFVAMPFKPELEDAFHYGIQQPLHAAGLLCERVDQSKFDGLIIERILKRIETAKVVIAELTGANANVYLEVGYAWGKGVRTVLLVRDVNELQFDVKAHRCIVYSSIKDLEARLTAELATL